MLDSVDFLQSLIVDYRPIQYLIILVGTTLGGEFALFVLGFLVAQGVVPLIPSAIISFFGAFLPNLVWFLLGWTKLAAKASSYRRTEQTFEIITEAVRRVSRGSHLAALIIIKFLVGTPVLLVMYTNRTSLPFKKFIFYQSIATILSILVIMTAGYYSGKGFSYVTDLFENIYATIGFILLVIVIIVAFQVWLEKRFIKE